MAEVERLERGVCKLVSSANSEGDDKERTRSYTTHRSRLLIIHILRDLPNQRPLRLDVLYPRTAESAPPPSASVLVRTSKSSHTRFPPPVNEPRDPIPPHESLHPVPNPLHRPSKVAPEARADGGDEVPVLPVGWVESYGGGLWGVSYAGGGRGDGP